MRSEHWHSHFIKIVLKTLCFNNMSTASHNWIRATAGGWLLTLVVVQPIWDCDFLSWPSMMREYHTAYCQPGKRSKSNIRIIISSEGFYTIRKWKSLKRIRGEWGSVCVHTQRPGTGDMRRQCVWQGWMREAGRAGRWRQRALGEEKERKGVRSVRLRCPVPADIINITPPLSTWHSQGGRLEISTWLWQAPVSLCEGRWVFGAVEQFL